MSLSLDQGCVLQGKNVSKELTENTLPRASKWINILVVNMFSKLKVRQFMNNDLDGEMNKRTIRNVMGEEVTEADMDEYLTVNVRIITVNLVSFPSSAYLWKAYLNICVVPHLKCLSKYLFFIIPKQDSGL